MLLMRKVISFESIFYHKGRTGKRGGVSKTICLKFGSSVSVESSIPKRLLEQSRYARVALVSRIPKFIINLLSLIQKNYHKRQFSWPQPNTRNVFPI